MEQLEESIKRYLVELDRADRDATAVLPERVEHLREKIAKVKQQMQTLGEIGEQMKASEDGQISLTDPDARSMATSGRGTGIVGYNVQTAVDAKHLVGDNYLGGSTTTILAGFAPAPGRSGKRGLS